MDRKAWIAITLSVIGLVAYQWWVSQQTRKLRPAPSAPTTGAVEAPATPSPAPAAATPPPQIAPSPPVPEPVQVPAQTEQVTDAKGVLELKYTNLGGGIAEATLLKHLAEHGEYLQLNYVGDAPIGALAETPADLGKARYTMRRDGNDVIFESDGAGPLTVAKKFSFAPGFDYVVGLDVTFTNTGTSPVEKKPYYINVGAAAPVHASDLPTYTGVDFYARGKTIRHDVSAFAASKIPLIGIETRAPRTSIFDAAEQVEWAAVKNQFFATILTTLTTQGNGVWSRPIDLPNPGKSHPIQAIEAALAMPGFSLEPGAKRSEQFRIYAGPKEYGRLTKLGHHEDEVMDLGMFKIISVVLLKSMSGLANMLWGSYAAAIIVLTICIKTLLYPLQNKSTESMKKMSALSPKMNEIKEKYKDDPTRMNQEMMKLYKDYGVNPFAGCLPMVIQIPIFFAFYWMLQSAVELRNHGFWWVHDLSQPDTIGHIAGFPINILPLLMAGTMLWQMKLTPKTGDQMQQRIFMFMPLIFVWFCYSFASALALYWTVQNLFTVAQLYLTRGKPAPELKKARPPEKQRKRPRL